MSITALAADQVIRRSHRPRVAVDLIPNTPAADPIRLDVVDGTLTLDAGTTDRVTCQLRTPFTEPVWQAVREYAVARVVVTAGYEQEDGTLTAAPVAKLHTRYASSARPDDLISISAAAVGRLVDDIRFIEAAEAGPITGDTAAVIVDIIHGALPALTVTADPAATGRPVAAETEAVEGQSRWQLVEDLADAADLEVIPRPDESLHVRPTPQLGIGAARTPVAHLDVGPAGVVVDSFSDYNRDQFANAVRCRLEWTDTAGATQRRTGDARNTDPADPSRYGGPAGRRYWFEQRPTRGSAATAARIARNVLYRRAGAGRGAALTVPACWWLEPGDPVTVALPWGEPRIQLVQTVTHDLVAGTTRVTTRQPYTTQIETTPA